MNSSFTKLHKFVHSQKCLKYWNYNYMNYSVLSHRDAIPRIVVPHKMMERISKLKAKHESEKHQEKRYYKGPLIISSSRKNLNHYKGQTYSDFNLQHFASRSWKSNRSKGDSFTIQAHDKNPAIDAENKQEFSDLGLDKSIFEALNVIGFKNPTNIQSLAIPQILNGQSIICVAETGSGKTLSYLLPMMQKILRTKSHMQDGFNMPQGVIIVPSRELAEQIYKISQQLIDYLPLNIVLMCGGSGTQNILRERPKQQCDILISTPGILSKLLTNKIYTTNNLQNIVMDEADSLLDDSFNEKTKRIISKLKVSTETSNANDVDLCLGMQISFVSATMPRDLEHTIGQIVPIDDMVKVTTPNIHRLMPHVTQKFIRTSKTGKIEVALKILKSNHKREIPTIVFVRTSEACYWLSCTLNENGIPNVCHHADMKQFFREGRFESFQKGEYNIMVCTDIGSRGLDTLRAQHIVNYDFPSFMSDYIHRVGRIGRVGSASGNVAHNLITHKWHVDLLWQIEIAVRRGKELHNVNANIKRKLTNLQEDEKKKTLK